jgi:prepilin-type processing-associated H-X9-DG protein
MAQYLAENKSTFPAAYVYNGMFYDGSGNQQPTTPVAGYINWSGFIYGSKANAMGSQTFQSLQGWDMFQCPSIDNGGLSPTNTFTANLQQGQPVDASAPGSGPAAPWNGCDMQAPRLAYTVNEAICPRNKFVAGFQGASRIYQFVKAGQVRDSSSTILASEWNSDWHIVQDVGEVSGNLVCKSHRPVSGFVPLGGTSPTAFDQLGPSGGGFGGHAYGYRRAIATDLQPDPKAGVVIQTTLDWVGRNHGGKKVDGSGRNLKTSNFLYVDGHVVTKTVYDTLSPRFEWGSTFYSLSPNGDEQP